MMLSADAPRSSVSALKGILAYKKGAAIDGTGYGSEEGSSADNMADFCKLVEYLETKDRLRVLRA